MSRRKRNSQRKDRTLNAEPQRAVSHEKAPAISSSVLLVIVLAVCVGAVVLAVHWPVLSAQAKFFDDNQYLLDNPLVQNPGWASAKQFLMEVRNPSTVAGYYQPLSMISLMIDYALGGQVDDLYVFHRTSLALHIVNTMLVITVLFLLFERAWVAALIGLLFGVHPMTVETVAWISERKTLLATFFALWAIVFYLRYVRQSGLLWYSITLAAYALSLLAKPTTTMLPVVLLLLDYWPLRRLDRRAFLEKLPLFVIAGLSAVITLTSQAEEAGIWIDADKSPMRTPLVVCHNIVFYLLHMFWPRNLTPFYPTPSPLNLSHPMILAGVTGTFSLVGLLLVSWRWTRAFLVGWLIFFVTILPTLGIIGFTALIASDRYAYLPSLGILMILVWLAGLAWGTQQDRGKAAWRPVCVIAVVLLAATLEVAGVRSYLTYWRDSKGLYQYMMKRAPESTKLHAEYGDLLVFEGQIDKAIAEFQEALRLKPNYPWVHNNLGVQLLELGRTREAEHHFAEAMRLEPDVELYQLNLSIALTQLGETARAIEVLSPMVKRPSKEPRVYYNLGVLLAQQGQRQEAIRIYREALRLSPNDPTIYYALGYTLEEEGAYDQALEAYQKMLQFDPDNQTVRQKLKVLEGRIGRMNRP